MEKSQIESFEDNDERESRKNIFPKVEKPPLVDALSLMPLGFKRSLLDFGIR